MGECGGEQLPLGAQQEAVDAPRMHHQGLPDSLQMETGGFPEATLDSLRARGHNIEARGYWGDVEAIIRTPAGWQGVSDPRRGGGGSASPSAANLPRHATPASSERFAWMPSRSSRKDSANFSTPSRSSVSVTSS